MHACTRPPPAIMVFMNIKISLSPNKPLSIDSALKHASLATELTSFCRFYRLLRVGSFILHHFFSYLTCQVCENFKNVSEMKELTRSNTSFSQRRYLQASRATSIPTPKYFQNPLVANHTSSSKSVPVSRRADDMCGKEKPRA